MCKTADLSIYMQVEACRARLYRMNSKNIDLEENDVPAPSAAWRESCKKAIIPEVYVIFYVHENPLP